MAKRKLETGALLKQMKVLLEENKDLKRAIISIHSEELESALDEPSEGSLKLPYVSARPVHGAEWVK